jgi:L-ascorbate metabolism protein UlaG (beta-lactamase superfamily)
MRPDERLMLQLPAGREGAETGSGSLFFIGTATVLLRYAGFTLLTDPNFLHRGESVHLGFGIQSQRLTEPAITMKQLPPLDLVLLSHLHEDHFDRRVEHTLDKGTPIVTTPQASRILRRRGFAATQPLRTWQTLMVTKGEQTLRITAMPARHGPGALAALLPETMGSMLEYLGPGGNPMLRIYISGDTLMHSQLKMIPQRYPDIDLALLHLGGTRLLDVLVTMDAQQGLDALELINACKTLPIHRNDYTVFKSPLGDFQRLLTIAGLQERVIYLNAGETYAFEVLTQLLR